MPRTTPSPERSSTRRLGVVLVLALAVAAATLAIGGAAAVQTAEAWIVAATLLTWAGAAIALCLGKGGVTVPVLVATTALAGATALAFTDRVASSDFSAAGRAFALAAIGALIFHLAVALPDGAIGGRRWLAVLGGYVIAAVVAVPLVTDAPDVEPAPLVIGGLALTGALVPVVASRCRRSSAIERSQIQWVGWAALVAFTITIVAIALSELTGWPEHVLIVAIAASPTVPAAMLIAAVERVRPRIDRMLVHTITASGLVLLATAAYMVIVVGFQGTPTSAERGVLGLSMLAAALIAVFALPARRRLEAFANQRVYGNRESPDAALHTFANRMSRAVPMDELLLQLAETLRKTMGLKRAEVWTGSNGLLDLAVAVPNKLTQRITLGADEQRVAARTPVSGNAWLAVWVPELVGGREDSFLRVAPVAHLGELLGFIVAERDRGGVDFVEEQDRVLTDIARQLGLALHNVRLDAALQASLEELQVRNAELVASQARIVASADESRRRIERNLHDGAQQHLVAMAVKLGLARQLVDADASTGAGLLEELRADVQVTLTELRELAHGIYPPLLRSRGLPEALAAAANRAGARTTVVTGELARFDPEVEAAVYFCCLEALQNAGKHAGPGALVTVAVTQGEGELAFDVSDDGHGFDSSISRGGDGFVNMSDRLGAIGGTLTVTSSPGAGTSVVGRIPLR